jgi:hypothetical protein
MKLKPVWSNTGQVMGFSFFCPGCDHPHVFYTAGPVVWAFDNNRDAPTFAPSLRNTCDNHPDPKQRNCHLNLTAGKLHFHGDCTHDLAGRIVDLPDLWVDAAPMDAVRDR